MIKKLGATELRISEPTSAELKKVKRKPLYIILDNVLDTYNIGSIFRLADAVAAKKIYLCGQTAAPPDSRIHKAAVGTEKWVEWQYHADTVSAIEKLKNQKVKIVGLEQGIGGKDYLKVEYQPPLALVVGNEQYGIESNILKQCDSVIELPMYGVNKSLNVVASLAVVLYKIAESF